MAEPYVAFPKYFSCRWQRHKNYKIHQELTYGKKSFLQVSAHFTFDRLCDILLSNSFVLLERFTQLRVASRAQYCIEDSFVSSKLLLTSLTIGSSKPLSHAVGHIICTKHRKIFFILPYINVSRIFVKRCQYYTIHNI